MAQIRVEVTFLGALQNLVPKQVIEIDEPATVAMLVQKLGVVNSEFNKTLIDPELKNLLPNALTLVNNHEIGLLQGLKTNLQNGDIVTIIQVVHGG